MEIKQMFKKFPLDKISGTKNALFLLSRAPTHHSFIFNLLFLHELKRRVCQSLSQSLKLSVVFSIFDSVSFNKVYIFVQQNAWTL